jgi:hypothetical protein
MTTNLTRFENDGIELVIDTVTGEVYATISGYAKLSGKNKSTISRRGVASKLVKNSQMYTDGGLQGVALIPEDLIVDWIADDNPDTAKKLMKLGTRVFLHQLAGYEVKSTAITAPQTFIEALEVLLESERAKEKLKQEKAILQLENDGMVKEIEQLSETVDELFNYSSLIRIAKYNGVSEKLFNWRKLKAYSDLKELPIKSVTCARYQKKNLYSHDAWSYCYPEYRLPDGDILEGV